MARTRMTRHELKTQDEITTTLQVFTEGVYAHKKEIIAGVSVVVIVLAAVIGWSLYTNNRNTNAQSQLAAAIKTFNDTTNIKSDKERYEKTIVEAQKTMDAYRSLPAGVIAQYYIAMSQEGLGQTSQATQNLQEVINRADSSLKGVAQFALAGIHSKHGEAAKAIEIYKQLYDSGGYSKAAAAYELAKTQEDNNQLDAAKEYYQKVVSDFPDSPFRQEAETALKRMGVTPIQPPQPAPATPPGK